MPSASSSARLRACRWIPGVPWRWACDARTKSARFFKTSRRTETAGVPFLGPTGGFKSIKTVCALTRSISHGLWRGDCSGSCARPWWPYVRESRGGSCEPGLMVGTCASSRALRIMAKPTRRGFEADQHFRSVLYGGHGAMSTRIGAVNCNNFMHCSFPNVSNIATKHLKTETEGGHSINGL